MKVVILNDTAVSTHFGCLMVMSAIRQLCRDYEIEIIGTQKLGEPWHARPQREMLSKADLVIVNAEGSVHHDRYVDLIRVADEYPSIFINGVFEAMSRNHVKPYMDKFKFVSVRESFSANYMESVHYIKPEVIPDLIFAHYGKLPVVTESNPEIFMSDSVVVPSPHTMTAMQPLFVKTMAGYSKVCAGRFHAIAAAAMMNKPFSAWRSNTWKNKAIMHDMGISHLYADEQDTAMGRIPDMCPESVADYCAKALVRIHQLFYDIADATYK